MSEESTVPEGIPLVRNEKGELEIHMANVQAKDNDGRTALMRASCIGDVEAVKALIKAGASESLD